MFRVSSSASDVYRELYLFVADDRDFQLTPTADPAAQKRYRDFYATTRLRRLVTTRAGSRYHDIYSGLKLVMEKLYAFFARFWQTTIRDCDRCIVGPHYRFLQNYCGYLQADAYVA